MTTLATIRSNVADALNRTDLSSQIDRAINEAINHYESETTWFNETSGIVTTVASQQSYDTTDGLPDDVLEILKVTLTQATNNTYTMVPKEIQWILDNNTSGSTFTGPSIYYAWYANKLYLYPTPDDAYTITLYYKKSYSDLSGDSDSNDWTDNASDLITSRSEWWVYLHILHNPQLASTVKAHELESYNRLMRRTTQLVSSGKLRSSGF